MFRGPGEFDPYVRGTHSRASTLALPAPSTIAGALSTYCISRFNRPIPVAHSWLERYLSVLGEDIKIKGPILSISDEFFVEDKCLNGLLTLEKLKEKCVSEYRRFKEVRSIQELEDYLELERLKPSIRVKRDIRVGVGLELRRNAVKMAKEEGGLYSAEYLDFGSLAFGKEAKIEILADIKGSLVNELLNQDSVPIKLGGETRISLMNFKRGNHIFDRIGNAVWRNKEKHKGLLALYLVAPALFKGGKRVDAYLKEQAEECGYKFRGISGESEVLGAGYSVGEDKRKPIYTSLKPGSILYLEGEFDLQNIYWESFIGDATQIGYGTFIPVPL